MNGGFINKGGTKSVVVQEVSEIEHHVHNQEKWFGVAAAATGETHVMDLMAGAIAPFALLSGNSDFGNWVQIVGSTDLPIMAGKIKTDVHRALITGTDSTVQFIVQLVTGESAGRAAKISAKDFTSFPYISGTNNNDSGISEIIDERISVGEKMWARTCCIGQNAKTINLYFGLHEYVK